MESVSSLRLCGIGMLILLLSIVLVLVPLIGFLAPIVGLVVLLIGYNRVSNELGQPKIWGNVLTWFLISLIGGIVVLILSSVLVYVGVPQLYVDVGELEASQELSQIFENFSGLVKSVWWVIGLVVLLFYVFILMSTFFFYRANRMIGEVLGENLFVLSSRLIWLGAIFSIVVVGVIVGLVGAIMLTVAFFTTGKK